MNFKSNHYKTKVKTGKIIYALNTVVSLIFPYEYELLESIPHWQWTAIDRLTNLITGYTIRTTTAYTLNKIVNSYSSAFPSGNC